MAGRVVEIHFKYPRQPMCEDSGCVRRRYALSEDWDERALTKIRRALPALSEMTHKKLLSDDMVARMQNTCETGFSITQVMWGEHHIMLAVIRSEEAKESIERALLSALRKISKSDVCPFHEMDVSELDKPSENPLDKESWILIEGQDEMRMGAEAVMLAKNRMTGAPRKASVPV